MKYRGSGYSVGPGYEVEGSMVFDFIDHGTDFHFLVREDKEFEMEGPGRRRENAVILTIDQVHDLSSWLVKRLEGP